MTPPVLVISRAQDTGRLTGFASACPGAFEVVEAVDGHGPDLSDHRALLGTAFWGQNRIKPGAFGCFLSHRRAWDRVITLGRPALICEDDARLTGAAFADTGHAGHDLTFVNARLCAWKDAVAAPGDPMALPVQTMMTRWLAKGRPDQTGLAAAPGADAYVLTPAGAAALLRATAQDRCVAGVDWLMLWRAMDTSALKHRDVKGIPEMKRLLRDPGPGPRALTAAIGAPMAGMAPGPSVIRHSVTVEISDLTGQSALPGGAETD